ncbi:MAG: DUF2785 domain-containing protein [Planctomycetota bacterium]
MRRSRALDVLRALGVVGVLGVLRRASGARRGLFPVWVALGALSACSLPRTEGPAADLEAQHHARGATTRDWAAILDAGRALPAGEDAHALLVELTPLLGARDPFLRDDVAYGLAAQWIVRDGLVSPDGLRDLARRWTESLTDGLGAAGDDRVLRRSFSALCLSLIVAHDNRTQVLDAGDIHGALSDALQYFAAERDLRDRDPQLGWVHATAHAADWLKFLARNRFVDRPRLGEILTALAYKLATPMPRAFAMGEDERMARAAAAVLLRPELPLDDYEAFLERVLEALASARATAGAPPEALAIEQNTLHFLRALACGLAAVEGLPEHTSRALDATWRALAQT